MNYFDDQNKIKCEQAPSEAASRPVRGQCLGCVAGLPASHLTHGPFTRLAFAHSASSACTPFPGTPSPGTAYVTTPTWSLVLAAVPVHSGKLPWPRPQVG